jgi:hypothetical protein
MAQAIFAQHATVQQDGQGNPFLLYTGTGGNTLYEINSTGNVTTAGGITAAGIGQPVIVYSYSASTGFAVFNAAAAVNMQAATAPAGTYRFTLYGVTTTTFVTNTEETIVLGYTDDSAANTVTYTTAAKTAGTLLPPLSSTVSNSLTFRSNGTAAITWTPAVTGSNATAGVMAISILLERLV